MAKQFTNAPKRPPLQGAKFGIPSPILESYSVTQNSTPGQVVSFTATGADELDRCEVYFRGKIIRATCCHPGIEDGMNVNMIEQPRGVWWATTMQKSWYSRPLLELIQKGHGYQAAVEYLLSFGAKWRPRLIIIDKRGQNIEPPTPIEPEMPPPNPWDSNPDTNLPYTFDDLDIDNDGYITPKEWLFDPYLFRTADTNNDGKITAIEWNGFRNRWRFLEPTNPASFPYTLHYGLRNVAWQDPSGTGERPDSEIAAVIAGATLNVSIINATHPVSFYFYNGVYLYEPHVYSLVTWEETIPGTEFPIHIFYGEAQCIVRGPLGV